MATLLGMPVELRKMIISFAITGLEPSDFALPAPSDTEDRGLVVDKDDFNFWSERVIVKHPRKWTRINSIPTLLVNRQLYIESLNAIRLLPEKHCYTVDIMLVNEHFIFPTWLSVPAATDRVEKVTATIRTVDAFHAIEQNEKSRNLLQGGDGGPCFLIQYFYQMLLRFFLFGPVGRGNDSKLEVKTLNTLELDVRSPDMPKEQICPKNLRPIYQLLYDLRTANNVENILVVHPEYLVCLLKVHIDVFLGSDPRRYFKSLLYEGIETIKLMLDGELRHEWHLADLLPLCEENGYKSEMRQIRINKGLTVLPVEEDKEGGDTLGK